MFNLVYETNVASCRIWDALGFKRIGRVKGAGNLKSYPGEMVDAVIYGRDLSQEDDFISEERFDKIRFYLKNGKYPNGADRAEKSRLRSAATHYKLTPAKDKDPEKLWLKGKEVIADPQKQYVIARDIHHKSHGGINKTTAAIAELYHWVRIKETVSQVIRNCPECSEMNKGLSAMRQNQNQSRYAQSSNNTQHLSPTPTQQLSQTPPVDMFGHIPSASGADSPNSQLKNEAAQQRQQHNAFSQFSETNGFEVPLDPALMEGLQGSEGLERLPPSPFLTSGQGQEQMSGVGIDGERASTTRPTAREELRRRLNRVAGFGGQ